eukprot:1579028-Rhodomonas_salina.1
MPIWPSPSSSMLYVWDATRELTLAAEHETAYTVASADKLTVTVLPNVNPLSHDGTVSTVLHEMPSEVVAISISTKAE